MAASFIGGTPVNLTGATWVTVVAAPASGKQREVLALHAENLDTVDHTFSVRKLIGGTGYQVFPDVVIPTLLRAQLLQAPVVLDATDMSLEVKIEGAHTTTAPRVDRATFEVP